MRLLTVDDAVYSPILGMGIIKQVCEPHMYGGEQYYIIFFLDFKENDGIVHLSEEWIAEEICENFNDLNMLDQLYELNKCYLKPTNITITHTKE